MKFEGDEVEEGVEEWHLMDMFLSVDGDGTEGKDPRSRAKGEKVLHELRANVERRLCDAVVVDDGDVTFDKIFPPQHVICKEIAILVLFQQW